MRALSRPKSWIRLQAALQVKLLARMRSLGMRPVLSAFAGFVPPAFIAKHPGVNVTKVSEWGANAGSNGTGFFGKYQQTLLEPTDPLFQAIGKTWIEEQTKIYGSDHIYQCDTYNEMRPRSNDLAYLAASASAVSMSMRTADPQAVWLMQDWAFSDHSFWGQAQLNACKHQPRSGKCPSSRLSQSCVDRHGRDSEGVAVHAHGQRRVVLGVGAQLL
eukprot:COSAG04_NODE_23_length_37908_cov_41.289825_3_plen_216_part_00